MHPQQPPPGGGPGGYDPIIGQTIGNYVVKQKLGEGGMGSVYLAEHPAIGKKVALKVLHAEFAANQEVVSRFFNEARAVNDIQHPNIVDIVDYGVLAAGPNGDQMVYFIMEFLPGVALSELIRREAPLAPERALSISLQVADALSASHAKGIIHRDLKPDNIMLIQRGRERDFVKLLDFGIAKLTGDQPGSRRTRTGIVMGTPAYMSPEQCEGRGNIDHRTDIYALGIVIYEMITGRVPFQGEGYGEVLVQHLTAMPAAPSTIRGLIPPHVEQIVMKALEKQPGARYPNMDEMMRALADPVGYVEAHGGIAGFRASVLTASGQPFNAQAGGTVRLTPSPLTPLTPVPGSLAAVATPTTLGASAGQVDAGKSGGGKKVGLFVGLGVVVAGAAVAAFLVLGKGGGKGSEPKADDTVSQGSADTTSAGSGSTVKAGSGSGTAEEGSGSASGSTAEAGSGSGSGSEVATSGSGSGTGTGTGSAEGAGTGTGTGTGTEAGTGTGTGTGTAAVAAEKITISIDSTPSGAMVFVGTEKDPRGKTPLKFQADKGSGDLEVKLFANHYKWEKRTVSTTDNQTLDVTLEKEKKVIRKPTGTTGGDTGGDEGDSDDTMNPFKKKKPK